ncbi:MAG: SUMF1/EgtB/PvdO family nonheme iron enzyme [Woeseiaceae bacterium]|nr:SUMF1/EgtB/PvdO family nonheme iron enzyme [Woeseiaceae bacterium]
MSTFYEELKRRKVTRVAIAYLVAAWLLMQVADVLSPILELPGWVPKLVFLLLVLGFVPALILAWAYDLTPDGIRRDAPGRDSGAESPSAIQYVEHVILGMVVLAAVGAGIWWYLSSDARWARNEVLPQIEVYIDEGNFEAAYTLALKAQSELVDDPEMLELWKRFTWSVSVPSEPPGATVKRRAYADEDAAWVELGVTPVHDVRIPIGLSLLRIELDGYRPLLRVIGHGITLYPELPVRDRSQPTIFAIAPERYLLDKHNALPEDMVRVPGTNVAIEGELLQLPDFFIDRYEVTNREYQEFVDAGGYRRRDLWELDFLLEGETLTWDAAMARFTDKTGRNGPSDWEAGHYPDGEGDHPVAGISWYEAAAFARFVGRELPTIHHWRRAFALGILTWMVPASNLDGETIAPVGRYQGIGWTGTFDMAGNVREWCFNAVGDQRAILGGAWNDSFYVVQETIQDVATVPPIDRSAANGFRLMMTADGTPSQSQFYAALPEPQKLEFDEPVSDEVFAEYKNAFEYDTGPFNATIEETRDERYWTRELISLDAGYDNERMYVYLYMPKLGTSRFQTIAFWPEHPALFIDSVEMMRVHLDFAIKNGRAVAYPVVEGTFRRRYPTVPAWSTIAARDMVIQQVRDFRRMIDYLETRREIDTGKLAYYGLSWGGRMGGIVLAVEPRLKIGILNQAGFEPNVHRHIDVVHYLPRVTQPVLQFNGLYDADFRFDSQAKPFFDLMATPDADKKHVVEPTGHFVSQPVYIGETLDWLDRYLGSPN